MHIALVGSGLSLQDAGRGAEIDAHDGVMRLFDCQWQVATDHGVKWTYGLIPGPWRRRDFARYVRDLDAGPLKGWLAYHFNSPLPALPRNTEMFDVTRWNRIGRGYSGNENFRVTRGFCMFVAAAYHCPDTTRVTGYGFDAIRDRDMDGYAYHRGWTGPVNVEAAKLKHDCAAERRMIDDITAETGIEITLR